MPASGVLLLIGVTDGARTRDLRGHIPALCQLSYDHQVRQYCHMERVPSEASAQAGGDRWRGARSEEFNEGGYRQTSADAHAPL